MPNPSIVVVDFLTTVITFEEGVLFQSFGCGIVRAKVVMQPSKSWDFGDGGYQYFTTLFSC